MTGPRLEDEDFEMIEVDESMLMGDNLDAGSGGLHPSRKRKCREEGVGDNFEPEAKKSLCADTCNDGRSLNRANLMFGLRELSDWTLFFCGNIMAGIVEVSSGS